MPVPLLAGRNVGKSYGHGPTRFDALAGVSIEILRGDSVAILGKSSSSKSTLTHLLALLRPQRRHRGARRRRRGVADQARPEPGHTSTFSFVFQ